MTRRFLLAIVLVLAGCVSAASKNAIADGRAVNEGHMKDTALPQQARDIAQDSYDLFCVLDADINGASIPVDVQARIDARRASAAAVTSRE